MRTVNGKVRTGWVWCWGVEELIGGGEGSVDAKLGDEQVVEGGVVVRSEVKGLSEWSVVKNKLVQVLGV